MADAKDRREEAAKKGDQGSSWRPLLRFYDFVRLVIF